MLNNRMASDATLNQAYAWPCYRHKDNPANADIWHFRRPRQVGRTGFKADLPSTEHCIDAIERLTLKDCRPIALWSSRDALIIKALALVLEAIRPVSTSCTQVRCYRSAKEAIRQIHASLRKDENVLRTDVKSYFATIDHHQRLGRLALITGEARHHLLNKRAAGMQI